MLYALIINKIDNIIDNVYCLINKIIHFAISLLLILHHQITTYKI
ncbi:hypothetical protein HMPREF3202_01976 [Prevotella bivia]|uniref:Uncharacterized protein n=1 Tax=Prevotella bivia TaxID=28125 RepID=A0A137SS42_9BACT|nr:hypothetical protein HMPREF3202_01976 [Prevotella bivia]